MTLEFSARDVPSPAAHGDLRSSSTSFGRKRPTPSAAPSDSNAFAQYRNGSGGALGRAVGCWGSSPCKKRRYPAPHDDGTKTTAQVSMLTSTSRGCAATVSPSTNPRAGASSSGTETATTFIGQLSMGVSSVTYRADMAQPSSVCVLMEGNDTIPASASVDSGAPSVDTSTDNHAAAVAASRLEAQIDDLTSDLGGWCLTDLKNWRRRRAAVAAAADSASAVMETKSKEDGNGCYDAADNCINVRESPVSTKGSYVSPRKDAPPNGDGRSPSVPNSPTEKEFLRQRRREARRSMLRGIANSGRRKLEV